MPLSEELANKLAAAMDRRFGAGHRVEALRKLSGGASRETWRFDTSDADGRPRGLILRRDPPGAEADGGGVDSVLGIDRATECRVIEAAGQAGVPVPPIEFLADPDDGIGAGFVMAEIKGETLARRILREETYADARGLLARQWGEIAATIHAVDLAALEDVKRLDLSEELEAYRRLLDEFGEPHPGFEYALRWLERRKPPPAKPALVHGDYRNGNFVVGPEGVRAVLDWELAHIGDPMLDLGWISVKSWRYGAVDKPVGGVGRREDLFAGYEAAGGGKVDPALVRYWEIFGTLRWGVMCMIMGFNHITGRKRSVELAAIGRRATETEFDLLHMID